MSDWLAIGPPDNWKIGIKKKVWAVSPAQRKSWEQTRPGDVVYFYATAPVKGIIGYGTVARVKVDEKPFWPEEKEKGHTLWPFRLEFSDVTTIGVNDWEARRIIPERTGIVFQRAFQPVSNERAEPWKHAMEKLR